jgi:hypothetical protein
MLISLSSWPKRRRPNTTGSRTAPKPLVSDNQWRIIQDLSEYPDPSPKSTAGVRDQPPIIDLVSSYRYLGSRLTQVLQAFRD